MQLWRKGYEDMLGMDVKDFIKKTQLQNWSGGLLLYKPNIAVDDIWQKAIVQKKNIKRTKIECVSQDEVDMVPKLDNYQIYRAHHKLTLNLN